MREAEQIAISRQHCNRLVIAKIGNRGIERQKIFAADFRRKTLMKSEKKNAEKVKFSLGDLRSSAKSAATRLSIPRLPILAITNLLQG